MTTLGTRWYIALADKLAGPLNDFEVMEGLRTGKLSWVDFACRPGMEQGWKRLFEFDAFRGLMPPVPGPDLLQQIQQAQNAQRVPGLREVWYAQFAETGYGPFRLDEVWQLWKDDRINGRLFVWKEGMKTWTPIEQVPEIQQRKAREQAPGAITPPQFAEKRRHARCSLVATISFSHNNATFTGICRDISVGGMKVICPENPGPPGTRTKLNIHPREAAILEPFSAEGTVVALLPANEGFCLSFDRLDPDAFIKLQSYVELQKKYVG